MGPGAVIYVPSLRKIGSGVQKLIVGDTQTHIQTHTHGQQRDHISLLYFFKIRKAKNELRKVLSKDSFRNKCSSGQVPFRMCLFFLYFDFYTNVLLLRFVFSTQLK
jgi:hypothetical protein